MVRCSKPRTALNLEFSDENSTVGRVERQSRLTQVIEISRSAAISNEIQRSKFLMNNKGLGSYVIVENMRACSPS
jgi:hypothetical protein